MKSGANGAWSAGMQHTLGDRIDFSGVGVHSGLPVSIALCPADADTGIIFVRNGFDDGDDIEIPAVVSAVGATELCTVLGDPAGTCVATVEHLLAALSAIGVDNVIVEIDGREVPAMDGSAEVFVDAIEQVGLTVQKSPRRYVRVTKPIRVEVGESWAEFHPHPGRRIDVEIDYESAVIGHQRLAMDIDGAVFSTEIARARTFGFMRDVERLWAAGFALGSSLENSVVIGDDGLVNPEGLRYRDEFVRHKMLDALGDLALAGAPIVGCYRSYKGGHKLNTAALAALLADETAYEVFTAGARVRKGEARVELAPEHVTPAFAPERS